MQCTILFQAGAYTPGSEKCSNASAAGGTLLTGTCFVDDSFASADFIAVEGTNSGLSLSIIGHFNKSESLGTAGFTVADHAGGAHFAILLKDAAQFIPIDAVRQIAYINIHPDLLNTLGSALLPLVNDF